MGRFEESLSNDLRQAVKIGEDNAECIYQMERWCKHVEIERTTGGLYPEMTGLPIADYSIGCPKIENKLESMHLRRIFSNFLVKYCAACPHHAPNGDISWGQDIIVTHREKLQKDEQAAKDEADRISQLLSDLRVKSKGISEEVDPEFYEILKYLETIFAEDEDERKKASKRLQQSACLGADLFPDVAIDLILLLAGSAEFSELMLPVCTELARKRPEFGSHFNQIALNNIEKGQYPEFSASVLTALGDGVEYPLNEVCIKQLLLSQDHNPLIPYGDHRIRNWINEEPDYPYSTAVIVRSFDADPESIQNIIRRELQNENDYERFRLCGAIKLIQHKRPQIVENLLDDFVRSLELDEEAGPGNEPSKKIIQILQSAFQYSVERVDQFLDESMVRVRSAVQEDIVCVYRAQFSDRPVSEAKQGKGRNRTEVSEPEKAAIQRLLSWAKDDRFEISIRIQALEVLGRACTYATTEMLSHFDSLFGYFAIISSEEHPPAPSPKILLPNQNQTQAPRLEGPNDLIQWSSFKRRLQTCLEKLCTAKPSETFDTVYGCLNQPSAPLPEDFKARCVLLLGKLGKDYVIRARVLPLIWQALMDYDSARVRAKAIHATVEIFLSSTVAPPQNLMDIIIVHLRDPEIDVHQAALQAVSWRPRWFDKRQSIEALECLEKCLHHDKQYSLNDICKAILAVGYHDDHLKLSALRMVESVFPTGEKFIDETIIENLIRFYKPNEEVAELAARFLCTYLARYNRDRYNGYRYSEFKWLYQLSAATYQRVADDLLVSAKKVAERDPWESCCFASLFTHFRAFQYEQSVLETVVSSLPEEPRTENLRASLRQLTGIAAGNTLLQIGDIERAEVCFAKGKDKI